MPYATTQKIQSSTIDAIKNKQDALTTELTMVLQACPSKTNWPKCGPSFDFFQEILSPLHRITQTRTIYYNIRVEPHQVSDFEQFAAQFYQKEGHPELYKQGIFAVDGVSGQRYHDVTGTAGTGKYQMLLPVLQATDPKYNANVYLYNVYSDPKRGKTMDYVFDCVNIHHHSPFDCFAHSPMIKLVQDLPDFRPASLTLLPIVPRDADHVVGLVAAVQHWDTVLNFGSNNKVHGIMVVLSDAHSYVYHKGVAKHYQATDAHDSKYDNQRVSFVPTTSKGPTKYTVSIYPTEEWMDLYIDGSPLATCMVMVALVVLTSLVFCLYDYLMNREVVHKDLLMQLKRQYVRYISHEIRTPLNVVHLGFQVLYNELLKVRRSLEDHDPQSQSCVNTYFCGSNEMPITTEKAEENILWNDRRFTDCPFVANQMYDGLASASTDIAAGMTPSLYLSMDQTSYDNYDSKCNHNHNFPCHSIAMLEQTLNLEDKNAIDPRKNNGFVSTISDWIDLVKDIVESVNEAIVVVNDLIDYDKIDSVAICLFNWNPFPCIPC